MICTCSLASTAACKTCRNNPNSMGQLNNFMSWNTRTDDYKQAAEYWQRMYEESFAERTCQLIEDSGLLHCSECGGVAEERLWAYWSYCPNCGARVTPKNSETTPKVVSE